MPAVPRTDGFLTQIAVKGGHLFVSILMAERYVCHMRTQLVTTRLDAIEFDADFIEWVIREIFNNQQCNVLDNNARLAVEWYCKHDMSRGLYACQQEYVKMLQECELALYNFI